MLFESGPHAISSTQLSNFSLSIRFSRVVLSYRASRNLSDSYPGTFCVRYAMYLPSGEYAGSPSYALFSDVRLTGAPPEGVTVQRSLFVELASMPSRWDTKPISFPSGERSNPTPPSEKRGESNSPGVRSVYVPEEMLNMSMCFLFPSRHAVQ